MSGAVVQRRKFGGHAWMFAQYLRGLRALGFRTVFVDRHVGPRSGPDLDRALTELVGGPDGVTVLDGRGRSRWGLSRTALLHLARRAELVINVMGFLDDEEILAAPRRRLFLDIDPGFGQMWRELGLADIFAGHDAYATVGSAIDESSVPRCGIDWIPTLPPVYLPDWPVAPPAPHAPITTVASWRGPFGPIDYDGTTYGLRVHEFRRFVDLPRRTGQRFELALDIDPTDEADREALLRSGWRLVDPVAAAGTPDRYRGYIARSKAEVMIAKHLYVATGAGWFSDRSACYLASGRPVLAQETGFGGALPSGDGLLRFATPDEAEAAVADLTRRYEDHCAAARAIAEQHLSTDVVLPRLLDAALR